MTVNNQYELSTHHHTDISEKVSQISDILRAYRSFTNYILLVSFLYFFATGTCRWRMAGGTPIIFTP